MTDKDQDRIRILRRIYYKNIDPDPEPKIITRRRVIQICYLKFITMLMGFQIEILQYIAKGMRSRSRS